MALGLSANEDDATLECLSRQSQSSKKNASPFVTFSQWVPFPGGIMDRGRISCFTVNNTEHKMCYMDLNGLPWRGSLPAQERVVGRKPQKPTSIETLDDRCSGTAMVKRSQLHWPNMTVT